MQLSQTAIQTELEKTVVEIYGLANPMFCGQQGAQGIYHEGIGMFSLTLNPIASDSYHPTT